jgi:hypothetical protein
MQNFDHNIGFREKRQLFRRKLSKIAENCDHNIDERKFSPSEKIDGEIFKIEDFQLKPFRRMFNNLKKVKTKKSFYPNSVRCTVARWYMYFNTKNPNLDIFWTCNG